MIHPVCPLELPCLGQLIDSATVTPFREDFGAGHAGWPCRNRTPAEWLEAYADSHV